jgi:hypothetical protein
MTFFERYFEALDGAAPHTSLDLVAEDVQFVISWAGDEARRASQFVGGRQELRDFIDAGDMRDWAHHVRWSAVVGDVEFALGETRRTADGGRIGTFLAVAQLDGDGLMNRYMVTRSPAIGF